MSEWRHKNPEKYFAQRDRAKKLHVLRWSTDPEYKARKQIQNRVKSAKQTTKEWRLKNPEKAAAALKKQQARERERYKTDPEFRKTRLAYQRKLKYGLSQEQFETLIRNQDNRCAGCRIEFNSENVSHVDHNHNTGQIRGLLCVRCNIFLGAIRDSTDTLDRLKVYLQNDRSSGPYEKSKA